jgi:hypothetical protein
MKKQLFLFGVILTFVAMPVLSQEESENQDYPIRKVFETTTLIDNQTTQSLYQGMLQLEIQHRFSEINQISDLFGIYGSANTRIALNYGIKDWIMVGLGTTRNYKLQDVEWKVSILKQTESGKVPVSLSYYGNMVIDARSKDNFGPAESYRDIHRLSYLTQVIVSKKIGKFSAQLAPTFAYYNAVDTGLKNFNVSLNGGLRANVLGSSSIILEYDQPLTQHESFDIKPNLGFGVEIGTSTHAFRVFVSNYNDIIKQRNIMYNTNNTFHFGFNISVRF